MNSQEAAVQLVDFLRQGREMSVCDLERAILAICELARAEGMAESAAHAQSIVHTIAVIDKAMQR